MNHLIEHAEAALQVFNMTPPPTRATVTSPKGETFEVTREGNTCISRKVTT